MDYLSNIKYASGSRKNRKRVGRGQGSGRGKTATRGMNGQLSRSGAKKKAWFEGGQMPLQRRVPKFGFTNHFRKEYQVVNVDRLQQLADEKKIKDGNVNSEVLKELGVIRNTKVPVKILGNGDLKEKLQVEVNALTKSAKKKLKKLADQLKLFNPECNG